MGGTVSSFICFVPFSEMIISSDRSEKVLVFFSFSDAFIIFHAFLSNT